MVDAQQARGVHHAALDLILGCLAQTQAEGHVVVQALVGVQRIVLEDHGDVAVARRLIVDPLAVDDHIAIGDAFEPGDHAQQGGFATTGGPDKDHELPVLDLQVNAVDDLVFPIVGFLDLTKLNRSHERISLIKVKDKPQLRHE